MINFYKNKYLQYHEKFFDAFKNYENSFNKYLAINKYEISSSLAKGFEWLFVFHPMTYEGVNTLGSEINKFYSLIEYLNAWKDVLGPAPEDDIFDLLSMTDPIAITALNSPNCIKNRFIYFSVNLFRETATLSIGKNLECFNFSEETINSKMLEDFSPLANEIGLKSFDLLLMGLKKINSDNFIKSSRNFRNRYHHQLPFEIEMGITSLARRIGSYEFSPIEFKSPVKTEILYKAISRDIFGIESDEADISFKKLNEVLKVNNLYDIWRKKFKYIKLEDEWGIIKKTKKYRNISFSELTQAKQNNILRLNRMLLEAIYPEICPKNKGVAYAMGGEEPLMISKLLPILLQEHQFCIEAFDAFWQLLWEQIEIWKQKSL